MKRKAYLCLDFDNVRTSSIYFSIIPTMKKQILLFIMSMLFGCTLLSAQKKSELQQRAEEQAAKGQYVNARSFWVRAYKEYMAKGAIEQGVEAGVKATALYNRENLYKEAFDLLRGIEQNIAASKQSDASKAAFRYQLAKERMNMYVKMRKSESAGEQIDIMERHAKASGNEDLKNDWLYNKAVYHYTFGQTTKGNEVFQEMTKKMTGTKAYDKVDEVFQTLIASGRKSGNATMVSQAYDNYIAWKDSASAKKLADETGALKKQITEHEATIEDKNSTLALRQGFIIGLSILAVALAVVLVLGALALLRFIAQTRRQKKEIKRLNENNALKAKFISNISAQISPALQKLPAGQPEVKALLDFSSHIQTLSQLETTVEEPVELEETQLKPFCEDVLNQIRGKERSGVELLLDVPQMSANINKEYVSHILLHLLGNAANYTPTGGHITLAFKKRGAHKLQFLVSNTGSNIPEEMRENVFKPFLEIKDLTTGDGLGLPICKQMAVKMNGDLDIDPEFTKGVRFVLHLQG